MWDCVEEKQSSPVNRQHDVLRNVLRSSWTFQASLASAWKESHDQRPIGQVRPAAHGQVRPAKSSSMPNSEIIRNNKLLGISCGSEGKESACNVGGPSSIPGPGRSPGEGNGTPLQYCCLENPMDGGAWWAAVHGVTKSRTQLSNFTFTHWRRKWQPTPVFLPGESQGRGSLVGCHPLGCTESDTTEAT